MQLVVFMKVSLKAIKIEKTVGVSCMNKYKFMYSSIFSEYLILDEGTFDSLFIGVGQLRGSSTN